MNKKECDRIKTCCAWVQRKLGTTFVLHFNQFDASKDPDQDDETRMTISRSNRDTDDTSCFIVNFDPKNTKKRSFNRLKRDCLHEMLHAMEWKKTDLWEEAMLHIKSIKVRKALTKRFYAVEESINYELERSFGPYIIAKWNKDEA